MGNHFPLLVRMYPGLEKPVEEIQKRFRIYYGDDGKRELTEELPPCTGGKWGSFSEFAKEIKQGFSRFYNKRHGRKGFFWSERFKSAIVDNGETLINCLAYIILNSCRAIVKIPEEYRWCSLGYHAQTGNTQHNYTSLISVYSRLVLPVFRKSFAQKCNLRYVLKSDG